jgi:Fe-S-cluster containining protein
MKTYLPILVERSVGESKALVQQFSENYDQQLRANLSQVSCTKGCHNCCYHPITISLLEGLTLYRGLADRHLWTTSLKDLFKATAERTNGLSFEVWLLSMIACPLLGKDGLCGAYEARPFACRITYSVGDPALCHPHEIGEHTRILPKREALERLAAAETPLLKRHQLPHLRMPLAVAVLYGERIAKGELDLEDTEHVVWKDLLDAHHE